MQVQATFIKTPVVDTDGRGTASMVQSFSYAGALLSMMHDPNCYGLCVVDTNLSEKSDASRFIPDTVFQIFERDVSWLESNYADPELSIVEFSFQTDVEDFAKAIEQLRCEFAAKNRRVEKDFNVSPMFHLRASQSGNIFVAIGHEAPNVLSIVDAKPPVAIGVDAKPK